MPELPEVETIRRRLAERVEGRVIRAVRIHRDDIVREPSAAAFRRALPGGRLARVDRRGKRLLFRLADGRVVEVQLRMTGRFLLEGGPAGGPAGGPSGQGACGHLAAELELDDGTTLLYDDVRRLGGFRLMDAAAWAAREAELGPEPLGEGFGPERLASSLRGRRAPVKNLLLDQRRVAGIGNLYASEILHRARLDPRRPGGGLKRLERHRLHGAIREVLREALERGGTTLRDYRTPGGEEGGFAARLAVYGREGKPCPRCGGTVRRIVQAGRSTFHCPTCQG